MNRESTTEFIIKHKPRIMLLFGIVLTFVTLSLSFVEPYQETIISFGRTLSIMFTVLFAVILWWCSKQDVSEIKV